MKEDFLHYVWKFQKFSKKNLTTISGADITIVKVGISNENAGPDFFNAKVSIGNQLWAGNVEIHIRSGDWYEHHHETDPNYDSIILHVVWIHNANIFRKDNSSIPTLELISIVSPNVLTNYHKLFSKKQKWINCENEISNIPSFVVENWMDRLYLERLQQKSIIIEKELTTSNNHWEGLLFRLICKNFGLKVNGEAFYSIAQSVNHSVINKCRKDAFILEALLFGQAGFFEEHHEDSYFESLKEKYLFLKHKFNLDNKSVTYPKYFRLRPSNFPTIRLSQLAVLFSEKQSLFSEIITANNLDDYYSLFNTAASQYWDLHYNFGVYSSKKKKKLTKKFINLLLINTIIPLLFCYSKYKGKDISGNIIDLSSHISNENNSIIQKFNDLGLYCKNSLQTQSLLQLKNVYCVKNKCLQCAIGNYILKSKS